MVENTSPNVPNLNENSAPVEQNLNENSVPADLNPEQNATQKDVAKSKGWKFWVGTILGTLLLGGAIFAGIFYGTQPDLFKGNINVGDLATVTLVEGGEDLILDLAYNELHYAPVGEAPEFYENNLTFRLNHDLDALSIDAASSDKYLLVYDNDFESSGTLVSLADFSGRDKLTINWQDASDVVDAYDKARAKVLIIEKAADGSIENIVQSNSVTLAPVTEAPFSEFLFTSGPRFELGTDALLGVKIGGINNNPAVSGTLSSTLSSATLRITKGDETTTVDAPGFAYEAGEIVDILAPVESIGDFFINNGAGDYTFEIIYNFSTGRTGFACGFGETVPCTNQILAENQEDSSFGVITQPQTLAVTLADATSDAFCSNVTLSTVSGVTGPFYPGNNYPVTFNLDNANAEGIDYTFAIYEAGTTYPVGVNPFSTDVIAGSQALAGGTNTDLVVDFDPNQTGAHNLEVRVAPAAGSEFAIQCPNYFARESVSMPVVESPPLPELTCEELGELVTVTPAADNNIVDTTEIDTAYTNTYTISSTHAEPLSVDISFVTGGATEYTWTVNDDAIEGDSTTVELGIVPVVVEVTFTSPSEAEEFNDVDLVISATVATADCELFAEELDTEVSSPDAVECSTEQQAIIDAAVAELPELSDGDYQEEFADMLEDLEGSDLGECELPEEPEACTDEQQDAINDIFDTYDLEDPTDTDYESEFEDFLDEVASYPDACVKGEVSECTDDQQDQIDEEFDALDPTEDSYDEDYTTLEEVYSNDEDYLTCTIPDRIDGNDRGDDPENIIQTEADILAQNRLVPIVPIIPDSRPVAPVPYSGAVVASPGIQGDTGPGLIAYPILVGMASVFARRRKED